MSRVSTEEQAKHGLSIDTQRERLKKWATENGHTVVGESVDAGISGKKPYTKRPGLMKFMEAIENGVKVDALVFCKLDRFYRSVKLYYQAVDIMDKHNVGWIAIDEDYETMTAGGRFKVNIMLSVAENEADRTAERIKVVFERKIERGECVSPRGLPLGYTVKDKHVVPDKNAEIVRAAFGYYHRSGSIRGTLIYLSEECGYSILYKSLSNMLKNPLYIGRYRDNDHYCEPIISKEMFNAVQQSLKKRSIRYNQTNRVYIFSGLIYCKECNHRMVGVYHSNGGTQDYKGYRCITAYQSRRCINRHVRSERKIEQFLLEHVAEKLDIMIAKQDAEKGKKQRPKIDKKKIEAKLDRLKDLYVDGLITKEKYITDREKLLKPLQDAEDALPTVDLSDMRQMLSGDLRSRYAALPQQDRQSFWRSLIDHIEIDMQGELEFYFKQ